MSDVFEHAPEFERGEATGHVRLGKFELHYEELFAEALEDGVITAEERARLDRAADSLGIDRRRILELEQALQAAYEAHHGQVVRELDAEEGARSIALPMPEPGEDMRVFRLEARVRELEGRVRELEAELEEVRTAALDAAVEVDFSDLGPPTDRTPASAPAAEAAAAAAAEIEAEGRATLTHEPGPFRAPGADPEPALRRVRHDPRDLEALRDLFEAHARRGDLERAFGAAHALAYLGAAEGEAKALWEAHRPKGLVSPRQPLSPDAWRRLLFHPDDEPIVGDVFACVVSAVLFGRVAALRHARALPGLSVELRHDPRVSTVQAVRAVAWGAAALGMAHPPLYAEPDFPGLTEIAVGVPPSLRIGRAALSGRTTLELAFVAGRTLAGCREEHFVRHLVPGARDLEDVFLAALTIASPSLPLRADVRARTLPIARAIEPLLDPALVDRLRGHFARFVEGGGRTNLSRWKAAADKTAARAGLLLGGDLAVAESMLSLENTPNHGALLDDLLVFVTSDRHALLRAQLGLALG